MKNIIKSLLIVVAVAAVAGGATWAYYHDSATVAGNTFSAGSMDLRIDSDPDGEDFYWSNGFTSNYTISGLYPGYPFNPGYGADQEHNWQVIDIRNIGVVDGFVYFDINRTTDFNDLSSNLKFNVYYDEHNISESATWTQKIWGKTISELITSEPIQLGRLTADGTGAAENIASVKIEWFVNPNAGNEIQGDSARLDVVFNLEQAHSN